MKFLLYLRSINALDEIKAYLRFRISNFKIFISEGENLKGTTNIIYLNLLNDLFHSKDPRRLF